jgi:hypothetical protein
LALPRGRLPSGPFGTSTGGNSPKFTFIGWNERPTPSVASMWPPVMWLMSAPWAVVGGGGPMSAPRISAAAIRPAMSPRAALST